MALITLKDVQISFGGPVILDRVELQIERGERICLIGRNGTGKSTLLKVINGELLPDSGDIMVAQRLKTALLPQEVPLELAGSVYDCVASGNPQAASLLSEYHHLSLALHQSYDESGWQRLHQVQQALETGGVWQLHRQVRTIISQMGLDETALCGVMSAGLRRRVYLARALVGDPDILLLDEPTNHLDIDAILWMEQFLLRSGKTMIFVTHDRSFVDRLATRIVEIDRGAMTSFPGTYAAYLRRKEELLDNETARNTGFDKQLKREEDWLRQGVKARRTRNEGRVRALLAMRAEVARRRARSGNVRLVQQEAERSGRLVIEVRDVHFSYNAHPLIDDFSTTVLRGDKVGVIGPNGCGKTTLLRLLLGEIPPEKGSVRHGVNLQIAWFDQLREQLDDAKTLQENVAGDGDAIMVNGKPRYIMAYLQDFLFSPEQARAPITTLSGGERNRLLLAKLFTQPSNVLVLDEPTNDLDGETLELLEEMLIDYTGTLFIVSHDRTFLNHVATSTLVFEGSGQVTEYVGGYDDWVQQRPKEHPPEPPPPLPKKKKSRSEKNGIRKLTFKERREIDELPAAIEALEAKRTVLFVAMADPIQYKTAGQEIAGLQARLDQLERELESAYARWEQLEALSGGMPD